MIHTARMSFRFCSCLALTVVLAACGSDDSAKTVAHAGKRIAVMEAARKPVVDSSLGSFKVEVPEPAVIRDWAQNGGNTEHSVGNASLRAVVEQSWSSSIGSGSDGDYKLLSTPVISENVAYAMDARGRVSATNAVNGDRLWRVETAPSDKDGEAIGGGVAVQGKIIYAATGFGEVIALHSTDGSVMWRSMTGKPLRSPPTVFEGRVFVITIENETFALDSQSGRTMWKHSGIAENATLMGASSPAVHGDTVVVAYSSGELFGLRAQNGRVVWGEVLAVPTQVGALPAIADIRGLPVIDQGRVYAISHSGRMICLDERTGERVWEADIGGINTPLVVGNAVYVVTLDNELIALTRQGGRIIWTTDIQKHEDPSDHDSKKVLWWGPVMAGGRLWLTNTMGHLAAYAPETGYATFDGDLAKSFYLPPIVANTTLFGLDDNGQLRALK